MTSFAERMAARKKAKTQLAGTPAAAVATAAVNDPKETAVAEPAAEPSMSWGDTPPWAKKGCKACKGKGFNSKGNPCRGCTTAHPKVADQFEIMPQDDGMVIWTNGELEGSTRFAPPPKVTEPKPAPAESAAPAEKVEPDKEPEPEATPATVAALEGLPKKTRGRPRKAFTLMINCLPVIYNGKAITLEEILHHYGKQLAEDQGANSYYLLNAFKRRDLIAAVVEKIALDLGNDVVVANVKSPDLDSLLAALRPLATSVVEGV